MGNNGYNCRDIKFYVSTEKPYLQINLLPMKTRLFILTLFLFSVFLTGCNLKDSPNSEPLPPAPGKTVDPSSTEPIKNEPGDTPPPSAANSSDPYTPRSYDEIETALAEKNDLLTVEFTLGIRRLTEDHFDGVVAGKEGKILAARQKGAWIIVFDGAYGSEKTYTCESVESYSFPEDMIQDCVAE